MRMKNVVFQYDGAPEPTLRDVSVRLSLGSRVGIVGKNGILHVYLHTVVCLRSTSETARAGLHKAAAHTRNAYLLIHC
jgi:ABC-type Mn2+/Zn2+ transport system ATPase subunit